MADERELKGHDVKKLAFVVSQLGEDLEDIVSGLESGTLTYEAASDAVATQLRWVLGQCVRPVIPTDNVPMAWSV